MDFVYCKGAHNDPAYKFKGTVDYSIHDKKTDTLFLFSIVKMNGQWDQLILNPPMNANKFFLLMEPPANNLRELFSRANGEAVKIECYEVNADFLIAMIQEDISVMPAKEQDAVMAALAEVFP